VDTVSAVADSSGTNLLEFQSLAGAPITPAIDAFLQTQFVVPTTNIVWSASLLNVTRQENDADVMQALAQGLRGHWLSVSNAEFRSPGVLLDVLRAGAIRDLTTRPLMPLTQYYGTCKTNVCSSVPNVVVVPVPIIPIRPPPI
jgi:hypothetical protein